MIRLRPSGHIPIMLDDDRIFRVRLFGHFFPDGVDVRSVQVSRTVPSPTPNYKCQLDEMVQNRTRRRGGRHPTRLTMLRSMLESHLLILLFREQTVVRTVPRPILWIGMRIIGKSTNTLVTTDSGEVPSFRMDDIVDFLSRCQSD